MSVRVDVGHVSAVSAEVVGALPRCHCAEVVEAEVVERLRGDDGVVWVDGGLFVSDERQEVVVVGEGVTISQWHTITCEALLVLRLVVGAQLLIPQCRLHHVAVVEIEVVGGGGDGELGSCLRGVADDLPESVGAVEVDAVAASAE